MSGIQGTAAARMGNPSAVNLADHYRLKISLDEDIDYLNIDSNKLLHFTKMMGKIDAGRMKHEWQTQERKTDFVANTAVGGDWNVGADTSGTLTVAAASAFLFSANDVFLLPEFSDSQAFYVESVVQSTGVITAKTIDGASVDLSAAGADSYNILRLGTSFEEGGGSGTIKSEQPVQAYNMVQIFQTPYGVTETTKQLEFNGISEWDKQTFEAGVDHAFDIEKAMWYGQRYENNVGYENGAYPQHFMGGLRGFISTNVHDIGSVGNSDGILNQNEFSDWVIASTEYSQKPMIFAGATVFEGLTYWAESKLELQRTENTLGMAVTKYLTAYGDVVPLTPYREFFKEDLAGVAFCVDGADVKYINLKGKGTHLVTSIQANDVKQEINEIRTWASLKVGNEKRHGYLFGADSVA